MIFRPDRRTRSLTSEVRDGKGFPWRTWCCRPCHIAHPRPGPLPAGQGQPAWDAGDAGDAGWQQKLWKMMTKMMTS